MDSRVNLQSYRSSMDRYAIITTPVSNTSVVNLRMPSTQASASEMILVIMAPASSCSAFFRYSRFR